MDCYVLLGPREGGGGCEGGKEKKQRSDLKVEKDKPLKGGSRSWWEETKVIS